MISVYYVEMSIEVSSFFLPQFTASASVGIYYFCFLEVEAKILQRKLEAGNTISVLHLLFCR